MTIERNERILFHEKGTLDAVTRWIATHHDGIAEWFKNVRRQYQVDRAYVSDKHRIAALLLVDASMTEPARIGVLDVGGATLEDVTAWSTWQDPDASRRALSADEEETQGNGGKAYMYALFQGQARILGVRDGRRNCKGFDGERGTVERGTPGWIPNVSGGREVEISSFDAELRVALERYRLTIEGLPAAIRTAIGERKAFTFVEGERPIDVYKGRIDVEDLIPKLVRHDQALLCLEQVDFFVFHNGKLINDGKKLTLPPITPYPGMDIPYVYEIPEKLPVNGGQLISTTEGGTREPGRLTLHTSAENMQAAWRNLRPRWQVTYRTRYQMVGSKPVSEVVGTMPGIQFLYGTAELPALEPAYVDHGRRRPKNGPIVEALDRYIAERIREVAQEINVRRKQQLDERALDEVFEENRRLDQFKNRFLPNNGEGDGGAGAGGTGPNRERTPVEIHWGKEPDAIEYLIPEGGINVGVGVSIPVRTLLELKVRDATGRPVRAGIEWRISDPSIATISSDGVLTPQDKGQCEIFAKVKGSEITTDMIPVRVWNVDHVLLSPRTLEIPLGTRERVTAEVTDDDGNRSTEVLLKWTHDAEDPLIVRIGRNGVITGNRIGRTTVSAGAGDVSARIPVDVKVIPNPNALKRGGGFPRLLLTGRDLDPATQTIREGDPDQPALWQDPSDYINNVWWLNLQSVEAAFAFKQRDESPSLWRTFHAERLMEMVMQVWMMEEFTRKGEAERPDLWVSHLAAMDRHRVRIVQEMWKRLEPYIAGATAWDDSESE